MNRMVRWIASHGWLAGSVLAALTPLTTASAQTAPATASGSPTLEEVVVTGTRIRRAAEDFPNPVISISAESIERSGRTNVADLLSKSPALIGSPVGAETAGSRSAYGEAGLNVLNLRNLGADRTLVLVDGRRHVSSRIGSAAVDIDTIPTDLIEAVDVLTGGIFSPECLGVQGLAAKVQLVYVALNGCANEQFTTMSCNKYAFRVFPVGRQLDDPMVAYQVKNFGTKWGIIYPDYVLGQSNVASISAALKKNGTDFTDSAKLAVPLNEANMTPYVSKIPTDGSIQVLQVSQTGSDLARVMAVIQQFGISSKVKIITALGKESFAGVYPDAMSGAVIRGARPSDGLPNSADDAAFADAWKAMAKKLGDVAGPLGGADKATPGNNNGYNAYASMKALVLAMRAASFTGKADTDKLIASFETLNVPQGPDFPGGPFSMNKTNHQGTFTQYLLQINGQKEDILATFPPDQMPQLGDCQAK